MSTQHDSVSSTNYVFLFTFSASLQFSTAATEQMLSTDVFLLFMTLVLLFCFFKDGQGHRMMGLSVTLGIFSLSQVFTVPTYFCSFQNLLSCRGQKCGPKYLSVFFPFPSFTSCLSLLQSVAEWRDCSILG